MSQKVLSETSSQGASNSGEGDVVLGLWGVRYQVKDVTRSIDFYTKQLGLKLDMKKPACFRTGLC
jgi:hypothetical protein